MNLANRETAIPTFVIRGLATMSDPADFSSVRYVTEAHLRDALAAIWWLHGLHVRTEVDVPSCGRIDVVGRFGDKRLIVEIKKTIETPSAARKAFAQAHMYKSYLRAEDRSFGIVTQSFVTAGRLSWDAAQPAMLAYPDVEQNDFITTAFEPVNNWRLRPHVDEIRRVASARARLVRDLSLALRQADLNLMTAREVENGVPA